MEEDNYVSIGKTVYADNLEEPKARFKKNLKKALDEIEDNDAALIIVLQGKVTLDKTGTKFVGCTMAYGEDMAIMQMITVSSRNLKEMLEKKRKEMM